VSQSESILTIHFLRTRLVVSCRLIGYRLFRGLEAILCGWDIGRFEKSLLPTLLSLLTFSYIRSKTFTTCLRYIVLVLNVLVSLFLFSGIRVPTPMYYGASLLLIYICNFWFSPTVEPDSLLSSSTLVCKISCSR
jgi:hypothetical protein